MVIKGKLITCKREAKTFNGKKEQKETLHLTLAEVTLSDKQLKELAAPFKDSGKKFTPDWVQDFKGYVNLKTQFELPCRDLEGGEHNSIEEFISESKFPYMGAEIKISVNTEKEGALYPVSLIFISEGKPFNAFAEFDNDEED